LCDAIINGPQTNVKQLDTQPPPLYNQGYSEGKELSDVLRQTLTTPRIIAAILVIQLVPLVLFPAASFSPTTQEWWLPVLLAVMVVIADIELIARRSSAAWPWYLMSFAQGFNIISRLMMIWPHATVAMGKEFVLDFPYILLTAVSLACSAFMLWYMELPETRLGLLRKA